MADRTDSQQTINFTKAN